MKAWRRIIFIILMLQMIVSEVLNVGGELSENDELKESDGSVPVQSSDAFYNMYNTPILEIEEKSDSYYDTDGVFYSQVNYDIVSLSGCGFETVSHSLQM